MPFCRSDDAWPKKQEHIDKEFSIRFSFSKFFYTLLIQLHQISFDAISQLRMAKPSEEVEKELGRFIIQFHCLLLLLVDRCWICYQPITINQQLLYSDFKFFTGFSKSTLIVWKLIVTNAIVIVSVPAAANIHQLMSIRYA